MTYRSHNMTVIYYCRRMSVLYSLILYAFLWWKFAIFPVQMVRCVIIGRKSCIAFVWLPYWLNIFGKDCNRTSVDYAIIARKRSLLKRQWLIGGFFHQTINNKKNLFKSQRPHTRPLAGTMLKCFKFLII